MKTTIRSSVLAGIAIGIAGFGYLASGKDSKVRILFSDDFGKTFKYVLADNVPNNGYYKLMMPYLTVDNINDYEGWSNFTTGGGRFKLEVDGEIACSIYPRYDYTVQQTGTAISSGLKFDTNGQRSCS